LKVIRGVTVDENGRFVSTWPGVITSEELHEKRESVTMNAATWAANFCSDPKPDGGMNFAAKNLHNYPSPCRACRSEGEIVTHAPPEIEALRKQVTVDPAFTDDKNPKAKTDRSGIVVSGVDTSGRLWIPHTRAGRWGPSEFTENLFDVVSFWKPQWVGIEDIPGSRALVSIFLSQLARTGRFMPYRRLKHAGRSKDARITPLLSHSESFGLYIHDSCAELVEELLRWGLTEHDDLADALAYAALEMHSFPEKESEPEGPQLRVVPPPPRETAAEVCARLEARARRRGQASWRRPSRRFA
jgi:hypothetical protein